MYGETTKRNPRHHRYGLQKNRCFVVEENHQLKNVVAAEYLVSKGIEFKKDMDLVMYACACVQTARGIMFNMKTQITVAALEAFNPGACASKDAMGLFCPDWWTPQDLGSHACVLFLIDSGYGTSSALSLAASIRFSVA